MPVCRQNALNGSSGGGPLDTRFPHLRLKGRSLEAEDFSNASTSRKSPASLLQHGQDMFALHILEVPSLGGNRFRQNQADRIIYRQDLLASRSGSSGRSPRREFTKTHFETEILPFVGNYFPRMRRRLLGRTLYPFFQPVMINLQVHIGSSIC